MSTTTAQEREREASRQEHRPPSQLRQDHSQARSSALERRGQVTQDRTAEQSVLGAMLLSKAAIDEVTGVLESEDFYYPAHQVIFDCILFLHRRGEPADPVTVVKELHDRGDLRLVGGAPYLHTLISVVPTATDAKHYAEIVASKAVQRRSA